MVAYIGFIDAIARLTTMGTGGACLTGDHAVDARGDPARYELTFPVGDRHPRRDDQAPQTCDHV
jgi:hypothetical protein